MLILSLIKIAMCVYVGIVTFGFLLQGKNIDVS